MNLGFRNYQEKDSYVAVCQLSPAELRMESLWQQALEGAPLQEIITRAEEMLELGGFDLISVDLWNTTVEAVLKYVVIFAGNGMVGTVRHWRAIIIIQENIM